MASEFDESRLDDESIPESVGEDPGQLGPVPAHERQVTHLVG